MVEIFHSVMQVLADYTNKFIEKRFGKYTPKEKPIFKEEPKLTGFVRKNNWKNRSRDK